MSEEAIFRAIRAAAEQRIVAALRGGNPIDPAQLSDQIISEFRQVIQFDDKVESLRTRLRAHCAEIIERKTKTSS